MEWILPKIYHKSCIAINKVNYSVNKSFVVEFKMLVRFLIQFPMFWKIEVSTSAPSDAQIINMIFS